ncbi:MAG: phage portal protein, partial [Gammaproteobacteria bacterium]|nr:phage portal protein [Gammaproteobacteria bacterium]
MTAQVLKHPTSKRAIVKRAFESAGLHPALSHWISSALPPDVDIRTGIRTLRARSREAAQNDDHAKYFLRLVESNVIGHQGINIQAKPKLLSGGEDKRLGRVIEDAWTAQCERGTWDSTGQLSRLMFDRLTVRTAAMDGEVLIRIHEFDPDSPTGFSAELIDAEALDVDYNDTLPNGNVIRMGVEMTPRRRPVAYHFFLEPKQPYSGYSSTYQSAERIRVPAADIIHVYLPEWVWASRGVPWMHTALRRMKMLSGYEEAAITAARSAAVKSAAYVATPDFNPDVSPAGAEQFQQDLSPGAMEVVPPGWDLKPIDWGWPNTEHGD